MNREEWIRKAKTEELATLLCHLSQVTADSAMDENDIKGDSCEYCIATDHCFCGHNGFLDWLQEEAKKNVVEDGINIFDEE